MNNKQESYTEENIIELLQKHKGYITNKDTYIDLIDKCQNLKLLMEIYEFQKQINYVKIKDMLNFDKNKYGYMYVNRMALFSSIPIKLISIAIKNKDDKAEGLFKEYEKTQEKNYDNVMFDLTNHVVLSLSEVRFMDQTRLDKLFCNFKQVKNKVRLYCFAANKYFNERHKEIALRYLGLSSFRFRGQVYPVPFKLSYLTRVNNPKVDLMRLISEAVNRKSYYGRGVVYTSSGTAKISVEVDLSEMEIKTLLFPIMVHNLNLYEKMLANLGMICIKCLNKGRVKCYDWRTRTTEYFPCTEKDCVEGQKYKAKMEEAQNVQQ